MKKITIGARGSKLSLAYVEKVKNLILEKSKDLNDTDFAIKTIKTSGDIHSGIKLSEIGGKNLFCKEIEENLLENKIDIAVHSLKDMESEQNENLIIGAYVKRNDPREVRLKIFLKRDGEMTVPSLYSLFRGADWQERETFDMYGVNFKGHPHPKRLLMPEDWKGWPLRKDYVQPDFYEMQDAY